MQKITEHEVIDYALKEHHVPSAYAKNWFRYNKDKMILAESSPEPPTAAEIRARQLQCQHEERERNERIYQQEMADPEAQATIAAIQERLLHQFK